VNEQRVAELLTAERLLSYVAVTNGLTEALRLYAWNMRTSGAVLELSAAVEVIVRNALDRELTHWALSRHGASSWFDVVPLDAQGRTDVERARARATRNGRRREVHGRVVAELGFGFWRYLVESRYLTTLWTPALHRAFPHGPRDLLSRQRAVRARMQQLHFVRNRAAHHEPIHARDLDRDHDYAVELLGWIHPAAAEWAQDVTARRAALGARPSA
jgi:hypothetical protein